MSSLRNILLLLLLSPIASTTPLPHTPHISVTERTTKKFVPVPLRIAKTYAKFGKSVPAHVQKAAAVAQETGSVPATPDDADTEYLAPVTIGGQTLNLDLDTGSSDLWVYSSELPPRIRNGHDYYDPTKSSTAKSLDGSYFEISYGDGSSVVGDVVTDTVSIGGLSVPSQAVELAERLSSSFLQETNLDGILGLGFSSINSVEPQPVQTLIDTASSQNLLKPALFTANLRSNAPGTYTFGSINSSEHTGDIAYTPISDANGVWEFNATGYAVGGADIVSESIDVIADTGTTLIYLPDDIVSAYYQGVGGAELSEQYGGYVLDCATSAPDLALEIGGYRAVTPGKYINYTPVQNGSSTCYGGLQPNDGINFAILGDVFLKSQFVVFDKGGTRIGFASKNLP